MATLAIGRKSRCGMFGICCLGVSSGMAAIAGIGRIHIIPVMTGSALVGNRNVGSCNNIIIVVGRKSSWAPSRIGSMASCAVVGNAIGHMIGIGGLTVIRCVAAGAYGRCVLIACCMTAGAIVGSVSSC